MTFVWTTITAGPRAFASAPARPPLVTQAVERDLVQRDGSERAVAAPDPLQERRGLDRRRPDRRGQAGEDLAVQAAVVALRRSLQFSMQVPGDSPERQVGHARVAFGMG